MRRHSATFKKSGALAFVAVIGLLMSTVSPASAAVVVTGAGSGSGWEYPPDPQECAFTPPFEIPSARLAHDYFELGHYGTFDGADTNQAVSGVAAYLGGTEVQITVESHIISPVGTHPDNGCAPLLPDVPPELIDVTDVRISGSAPFISGVNPGIPPFPTTTEGEVFCTGNPGNTGSYQRVSSAVVFVLVVDCTITGNVSPLLGSVEVEDMTVLIEGTMNPCLLLPPVDITTNPECALLGPEGDDAGSHLVTTYEAAGGNP